MLPNYLQSKSCLADGLSVSEVLQSRTQYGENTFTRQKRNSFLNQYLESFGDPIIKILVAALVINMIVMFYHQNWFETIGIAVAVFLATFLSTLSEYGSESAFLRLQEDSGKLLCRVKRKEGLLSVPISELVVGDIVLLQAGERIPADGLILSGKLRVDQSSLNGESAEVTKTPLEQVPSNWSPDHKNQLFRGAIVTDGEGMMQIANVGNQTIYGSLALELLEDTVDSPLKERLATLARMISRLGYTAAALVTFADLFNAIVIDNHYVWSVVVTELCDFPTMLTNVFHAALLAISVIVVAVPEGLPMMITVVLSSNMLRMLKDKVLVRKLVGIETAGNLNILFTDKTGTLTTGNLTVTSILTGDGSEFKSASSFLGTTNLSELVALSCICNSSGSISGGNAIGGNATERALLQFAIPLSPHVANYSKVTTVPFDSTNKYSWERISGKHSLVLVKGAPEKLLPRCYGYYDKNGALCRSSIPYGIIQKIKEMTEKAMRVLVLATSEDNFENPNTANLTLVGVVGIRDELRREVKKAVETVRGAGIQTVMITGDNRETAIAIGKEAGLLTGNPSELILTSEELSQMDDDKVSSLIPDIRIIARALPKDKSRLVRLSQELGLVAGMTGDGINDAPALKKADVGFAMGSGTEVAKEAGDIVIMDNNFSSIGKAILYGRTIFKSIQKFIVFQLTMNLCAVGVSLIGPFIGIDTPVTVVQMLWINIIMDTLAGLAFAGEIPLQEYMKESPKNREDSIVSNTMINQIVITGSYMIVLCTFFLKSPFFRTTFHYETNTLYFMTAFFSLFIFTGIFNSFNTRTYRINIFANLTKNHAFLLIMTAVTVIQTLLIYFGGEAFRTVPMMLPELIYIILIALTVIPFDACRKICSKL